MRRDDSPQLELLSSVQGESLELYLASLTPQQRGEFLGKQDNELALLIGDDAYPWCRDE